MGLKEAGLRGSLRNASSVLPAFFDVTVTNTNSPVREGDVLSVDYSANNTGDVQDTQDIRLEIDSVEEDRDSNVTLAGGVSTTGTLQWDTTNENATTYTATVLSNDDSDSVTVEVESAIPDSVVSRDPDNDSFSTPGDNGVRITTDDEWEKIGAEISSNTSGITNAYIYRVSDGSLMGDASFISLSGGDTFTIDLDSPLQPYDGTDATKYNFVVDANGSDYTTGLDDSPSFPYTSSDGNLRIINGAKNPTDTTAPYNLITVGNVGFS